MPDLILAIETSNPSAWTPERAHRPGVALGRLHAQAGGVDMLGVEPIELADAHRDDLMPAVERLCRRCGVEPSQLARVVVSVGPGGYTALRVAVVTAKMLVLATGCACVPVPSALVVARRVAPGPAFAVCLASKGEDCFVTLFDGMGRATGEGAVLDAGALPWGRVGKLVTDRHLPESIRARAAREGVGIEAPEFDPVACLGLGAEAQSVDSADAILPIYPRIPEAVRKWRELGRGGS